MQRLVRLMLLVVCLTSASVALAVEASPAASSVEKLHATLLEVMQHGVQLGFAGRAEKLSPVLNEVFDFPTISRLVTGRYWSKLAPAKQREFIEVFSALSTATYAENFKSFSGQRFETRTTEDKKNAKLVKTAIIDADGSEVPLNYLLAKQQDMWRIVNVVAQGVSDLSLKRAEYTAVIGSEGIDALIAKLKAKVASYGA